MSVVQEDALPPELLGDAALLTERSGLVIKGSLGF